MIWSQEAHSVKETKRLLRTMKLLRESGLVNDWLQAAGIDFEPVHYVAASLKDENKVAKKLVTPYATINEDGYLIGESAFSIASWATVMKHFSNEVKQQFVEAHAIAERTALTRGLFTPSGRKVAEQLIAGAVPETFRDYYIQERLGYLHILQGEVERHDDLRQLEKLTIT